MSSGKTHGCAALVLMCIDYRFREQVQKNLQSRGLESYDIIAFPGASLGLASAKHPARSPLLNAIDIAKNLHGIQKVIVVDHEDCGAYGGASSFESPEAEKEKHQDNVVLARRAVDAEIGLPLEGLYARLDGTLENL